MPRQPNQKSGSQTTAAADEQKTASKTVSENTTETTTAAITSAMVAETLSKDAGASVRVLEKNKNGQMQTTDRPVSAEDILSFRVDDSRVIAVTIDGRKHSAEIHQEMHHEDCLLRYGLPGGVRRACFGLDRPDAIREAFEGDLRQLQDLLQGAIKRALELSEKKTGGLMSMACLMISLLWKPRMAAF